MKKTFSCLMDAKLKERLDKLSAGLGKSRTAIMIEALENYLDEFEDFSGAAAALEELKNGDYAKASKQIDKVIKNLQYDDDDFSDAINALETLKTGDYKKASEKIDNVVKNLKD